MTGRLYFFNVGPFLPTKQIKIFCFINWKMTILCNNMLKFIKTVHRKGSCGILRYPVVSCGILRYPAVIRPTPPVQYFAKHDYLLHLNQSIIKISQAFDDGSNLSRKSDTFLFFLQFRLFKYRSHAFSKSVKGLNISEFSDKSC